MPEAFTGRLEDTRSAGGFTRRKARAPLSLYSMFSNQNLKGFQCSYCRAHIKHLVEILHVIPRSAISFTTKV